MTFNKTLLCVAIAALLSGCFSNDDKDEVIPQVIVKNSIVCVDANGNAQCDKGEVAEAVTTWTDSAIAVKLSATSPLVYEGDDGYIFTAPSGSTEISPKSTLFANEQLDKQAIATKTMVDIDSYLQDKLGTEAFSTAQEQDFLKALKVACDTNLDADRDAVIAAMVNKVITTSSDNLDNIKDITVSASDIEAAATPYLSKLD